MDANDVLYAIESSADYDPGPGLERITAPLLAINFEDDLINPPELGILEREIRRVKRGKAIVIPRSDRTRGHGTHTLAAVWKEHLVGLLAATEPASPDGHGDKGVFPRALRTRTRRGLVMGPRGARSLADRGRSTRDSYSAGLPSCGVERRQEYSDPNPAGREGHADRRRGDPGE